MMYYHPLASGRADPSSEIVNSRQRATPVHSVVIEPRARRLTAVHRILIPVDGSETALRAITHLMCSLDRASSSEVHLVNVQPLVMQGDFALNVAVEAERRARLGKAREALDRARELLDVAGMPCKTAVLFGDPAQAIARYAKERDLDAIVMGTRGLGSLNALLLRSVATKLVSLTDIPVTLVKSRATLLAPSAIAVRAPGHPSTGGESPI